MSFKILAQLSHFITMVFGVALGIAICIFYQYRIGIFIENLAPVVLVLVFLSGLLRIYTLRLWKKYDLESKVFNEEFKS